MLYTQERDTEVTEGTEITENIRKPAWLRACALIVDPIPVVISLESFQNQIRFASVPSVFSVFSVSRSLR